MSRATSGQLAEYLARIGHAGPPQVDLATLSAIHRRHARTIVWESIDCFLGRPGGRDPQAAFDKLVRGGRGGWCFEMNGLLGWMLEAIGFRVTRLAGAVMREQLGDAMVGNHLLLLVRLEQDYIADVGLGSGLLEPIPLLEGVHRQRHASFRLQRLDTRWWRFHNQPGALPASFDFALDLQDDALLARGCRWLQQDAGSPFRQNVVIQRHGRQLLHSLVNRSYATLANGQTSQQELRDAQELAHLLETCFGLPPQDAAAIWERLYALQRQPCPAGDPS